MKTNDNRAIKTPIIEYLYKYIEDSDKTFLRLKNGKIVDIKEMEGKDLSGCVIITKEEREKELIKLLFDKQRITKNDVIKLFKLVEFVGNSLSFNNRKNYFKNLNDYFINYNK
jgi:hypothetical protein